MTDFGSFVQEVNDRLYTATLPDAFFEVEAIGFRLEGGVSQVIHEIRQNGVIDGELYLVEGESPVPYLIEALEAHEFLKSIAGVEGTAKS
jgi:hypothetical protein